MSTSDIADVRYQAYEHPQSLGENPTEDSLKALFSDYGYVWVCKIMNETSNNHTFYSPYYGTSGDIAPGKQESYNSKGYIPYSSAARKCEIKYYNTALEQWNTMSITDLARDWLLSFEQPGVDVDEREVRPKDTDIAEITLVIFNTGYKFEGCSWGDVVQSSLSLRAKWRPT